MPAASSFRTLMSPGVSAVTDQFNRPDGTALTTTDTGQPWEIVTGTWTTQNNRAYTSTSASSDPIAVVNAGTPEISSFTLNIGTKDAAIIRFEDTSNFLRVVRGYWQTSSTAYCTYTNYSASGDRISCSNCGWSCAPSGCGCDNASCSTYPGGYCTTPETDCNTNYISCDCWCSSDGTCQQACGTNYYNNYRWALQQMLGGSLTTLYTSPTRSTGVSAFTISALGGTITVADSRDSTTETVSGVLTTATKFGIGRANYQSGNSTAIDNFSLSPL